MEIKLVVPAENGIDKPPQTFFYFNFIERIKILFKGYFVIKGQSALNFQKQIFSMTVEAMDLDNRLNKEKENESK